MLLLKRLILHAAVMAVIIIIIIPITDLKKNTKLHSAFLSREKIKYFGFTPIRLFVKHHSELGQ